MCFFYRNEACSAKQLSVGLFGRSLKRHFCSRRAPVQSSSTGVHTGSCGEAAVRGVYVWVAVQTGASASARTGAPVHGSLTELIVKNY